MHQELVTTSDQRNTAFTTAPDHTKPIKNNKNDEKDPRDEAKGEATVRKNKKARNEASSMVVSPGGAYCSAWDLCSCALLQLDNNRHYSIVSEVMGCLFQWFYSKKNDGFIPQGTRSNSILTGERG